ncbi:MAG: hypothetical protein QOG49_1824, partial [Frankiaceae bacterium]|nr:hypothetical protein [Frankiaceae bacterium]
GSAGRTVEEPYGPIDAYRLMAEGFARLVGGADDEFTVTSGDSLTIARTMDDIRARTRGDARPH